MTIAQLIDILRTAPQDAELTTPPNVSGHQRLEFYLEPRDYAGLGHSHRMIAWVDDAGYQRSITW